MAGQCDQLARTDRLPTTHMRGFFLINPRQHAGAPWNAELPIGQRSHRPWECAEHSVHPSSPRDRVTGTTRLMQQFVTKQQGIRGRAYYSCGGLAERDPPTARSSGCCDRAVPRIELGYELSRRAGYQWQVRSLLFPVPWIPAGTRPKHEFRHVQKAAYAGYQRKRRHTFA